MSLRESLAAICRQFEVEALYVFGSRAAEVYACAQGLSGLASSFSDVDIGALPESSRLSDPMTYWLRAGAVTGLVAIALQEFVEFSLQMPGNAVLFTVLAPIAIYRPAPKTGRLSASAPTALFELRRGLAVALRTKADKASAVRRSFTRRRKRGHTVTAQV